MLDAGHFDKLFKKNILHKELFAVCKEPPQLCGFSHEWMTASRLDNIASVASCLEAFMKENAKNPETLTALSFWNHEEIGSETQEGAGSSFFSDVFDRLCFLEGMLLTNVPHTVTFTVTI